MLNEDLMCGGFMGLVCGWRVMVSPQFSYQDVDVGFISFVQPMTVIADTRLKINMTVGFGGGFDMVLSGWLHCTKGGFKVYKNTNTTINVINAHP